MEGNNWKVTEGNCFLFINHGPGYFSKHLFFGYSNLKRDFFFTLEHYFGSVFLRSSFLINYWRPLARCSMKLFSLFGVKKEGKINKKKGKTS